MGARLSIVVHPVVGWRQAAQGSAGLAPVRADPAELLR